MVVAWSPVSARRYYFTLLTLIAALILIFYQYALNSGPDYSLYYSLLKNVVNEENCQLPVIDPFDETIKKYIIPVSPLVCKKLQPELTKLVDGQLLIDLKELADSGYSVDSVKCEYRCFFRSELDDVTLRYDPWVFFSNGTFVESCEFIEVSCSKSFPPIKIYSNLHSQIVVKKDVVEKTNKKPGILLFVVDSVSQNNWKRNLLKTLGVLENEYSATVFKGFTKVGDNSFPNAVAFLAGIRVMTVGYEDELKSEDGFFDNWPLIWKDFKNENYTTFYAEDYPEFNLFKYLANGFKKQPTDHYFRPFWLQLYGSFLHRRSTHLCYGNNPCHKLQISYLEEFIKKYHEKNAPIFALNWLTELGHDWLNQVGIGDEDFAEFFRRMKPYLENNFVFVFADHGHRFDPIRQSVIGRIEERMPFFSFSVPKFLENIPGLKSTIKRNSRQLTSFWDLHATLKDIIALSRNNAWKELAGKEHVDDALDEGYGDRGSSLLRPPSEEKKANDVGDAESDDKSTSPLHPAPKTKEWNNVEDDDAIDESRKLSLIHPPLEEDNFEDTGNVADKESSRFRKKNAENLGGSTRGLSLLRPLPKKRNCEIAGIPEDFCICQRENQINVNDSRVKKSAKVVIEKINKLLEKEIKNKKCRSLELEKIKHSQTFLPNLKIAADSSGFYVMYRVTVKAFPSGAFFEGTVRHSVNSDGYTVIGDINRINKYGNQSSCVQSALLRKYCFCI
ncbi:hypothetical protein FO519_003676 [Halicephalobus sp. NKZ332]|nr:hypothetical protein FO519_003676 [Halicephalobus sp. NKZ332]